MRKPHAGAGNNQSTLVAPEIQRQSGAKAPAQAEPADDWRLTLRKYRSKQRKRPPGPRSHDVPGGFGFSADAFHP
jgi:hypothetical protein